MKDIDDYFKIVVRSQSTSLSSHRTDYVLTTRRILISVRLFHSRHDITIVSTIFRRVIIHSVSEHHHHHDTCQTIRVLFNRSLGTERV